MVESLTPMMPHTPLLPLFVAVLSANDGRPAIPQLCGDLVYFVCIDKIGGKHDYIFHDAQEFCMIANFCLIIWGGRSRAAHPIRCVFEHRRELDPCLRR